MQTECTPALFEFEPVDHKKVVAGFDCQPFGMGQSANHLAWAKMETRTPRSSSADIQSLAVNRAPWSELTMSATPWVSASSSASRQNVWLIELDRRQPMIRRLWTSISATR